MNTPKTDYTELLTEIADAEDKDLLKAKTYTDQELFLVNAILEGTDYSVQEAVKVVLNDLLELYQGITEMSEVAYHDYKVQKKGAVGDMDSFSLELVYDLEKFVDWYKWGLELQKEYNYIWSSQGIIMIWD